MAYADFVTAMMAFFLLMWLITMVAPEKRARVATYFKEFSLFEKSGAESQSVVEGNGAGVTGEAGGAFGRLEKGDAKGITDSLMTDQISPDDLKERIRKEVEKKLADVQDQVVVDVIDKGVRIQLIDREGNPLFPVGKADPNTNAQKIMSVISESIKPLTHKIVVEGHTDALSYASGRYTNWELSTERASAARKLLEQDGLDPDRIAMVAGYAATEPLIKGDPNDPRNRRISLILLFQKSGPPEKPQDNKVKIEDAK